MTTHRRGWWVARSTRTAHLRLRSRRRRRCCRSAIARGNPTASTACRGSSTPTASTGRPRRGKAGSLARPVVYELHVGTFTDAGTFDAAIDHLDHLVDLGIDFVELLPVTAFPGKHGWGYDGVFLYAVHDAYGGPHGLGQVRRRLPPARYRRTARRRLQPSRARRQRAARTTGRTSPTSMQRRGGQPSTSAGAGPTKCAATSSTTR